MSKQPPSMLSLFPCEEKNAAENVSSRTNMVARPVSTVLSLNLNPNSDAALQQAAKPCPDLSASVRCFKVQETDQEPPVPALPNHQEYAFTLLSSSTDSEPSTALCLFQDSARIKDYLPTKNPAELTDAALSFSLSLPMKRKGPIILGPIRKKTENSSHLTVTIEEGVAKKQVEKTPTGLRLEVERPWIKKWLSLSDVNDSSRLLLPKDDIRKYVLPLMDEERSTACQSKDGLRVKIWDLDTLSEHELSLKQWKTGSFLLTSNWNAEFVNRRSLKEGDSIGLFWDFENLRFFFHKFNAQS